MKAFIAFGSRRTHGNTAELMNTFIAGMRSEDSSIEFIDGKIYEKEIKYCNGCESCKTKTGVCVLHDDMFDMYDDIFDSDILILAAPTYWFNISGQLKVFLDRLYGMRAGGMRNKALVYITTFGDVDEYASGAHNAINSFKEISEYLSIPFEAVYASTGARQVADNSEIKERVFAQGAAFAKKIGK